MDPLGEEKSVSAHRIGPEAFQRLRKEVLIKRPILENILRKKGRKNLLEYANEYVDVNLNPTIPKRQNDILETIFEVVENRFGKKLAWSILRQLEKFYFVSTADHVGPLTHPFFVNSNLLTAATMMENPHRLLNNIIVLACGKVSHDNSSFPRGLLFHTYINNQLQLHRLPFLSANPDIETVYCMSPYRPENIKKASTALREKFTKGEIAKREYDLIAAIIQDIYSKPEIFACKNYAEQMSKTNFLLWKNFFRESGIRLPNLVQLELENIVVQLLIKYHLTQDTIINHILLDQEYEHYLNTYFEGIFGSFSRKDASGSYLFWALPEGEKNTVQLWRKGNYLISKNESYKIELHPEVIKNAMESKELIPGLLLDFITICFYYGLKCVGGFNQVNYLTLMKNAYIKMNVDLENYRSIEVCARAQTKEIADGLTFAFLGHGEKELALATGIDLILYGKKESWSELLTVAKNITFEEALNPLMPEIYRITYEKNEWEEGLLSVTDRDIMELIGLDKKIKPCVRVPS